MRIPSRCWTAMPGPATSASCGTSSSGWLSSRQAIESQRTRSRWRSGRSRSRVPSTGLQGVRDSAERERIRQALDQTDWNVTAAARL